jgi:hypothetical protein
MPSPELSKRGVFLFAALAALLMLAVLPFVACDDDDDSDDNPGASPGDDDDSSADDDDNDAIGDDDDDDGMPGTDDDATPDDDDDQPPGPARLLLIGEVDGKITSWLSTDEGWEEMTIPAPYHGYLQRVTLGPSLAVDGEYLLTAWNIWTGLKGPAFAWQETTRNRWVRFDPENGWAQYEVSAQVGRNRNVRWIEAPPTGPLWTGAHETYSYYTSGIPRIERFDQVEGIYFADGGEFELAAELDSNRITAMAIPEEDFGIGSALPEAGLPVLVEFDGLQWTSRRMPLSVGVAPFNDLLMFSADHGYALFDDVVTGRPIKEWDGTDWTPVTMPAACRQPSQVRWDRIVGHAGHLVAYDVNEENERRFAEYRDGVWTCRTFDTGDQDQRIVAAQVLDEGTVFFLIMARNTVVDLFALLRVEADDVFQQPAPQGLTKGYALHAFGEHALPRNDERPPRWGY